MEIIRRNEEDEVVTSIGRQKEEQDSKQAASLGDAVWGLRKHRREDRRISAPQIPSKTLWKTLSFSDHVERISAEIPAPLEFFINYDSRKSVEISN